MSKEPVTKDDVLRAFKRYAPIPILVGLLYFAGLAIAGVAFGLIVVAELRALNEHTIERTKAMKELEEKIQAR